MILVLSDEFDLGRKVLGMFNSGCLQYAKESIQSQHFELKTEMLNWVTYLKIMLLNTMASFFSCDQKGLAFNNLK